MAIGGRFGVVPRLWPLTVVVVVLLMFSFANARKVPPLLEDSATKNMLRAAECTFGGQARELGSTWFADLGPPFGVMYCIKCECVRIIKKHKIVAKVQCKNIKDECPKPTCDEPVLFPGICCKICPEDLYSLDASPEIPEPVTHEEDEKGARHFAALMVGRGRPPAAARFWLRRRSLYISIEGGNDAKSIQLIDNEERILQEVPVATKMIERSCTSWRRLPRDYRRLLREGKMSAGLVFGDETKPQLVGQIITHGALNTEIFSALLEVQSDNNNNWGATAAISTHTGATPYLHISLMFDGILNPEEILNSNFEIILENVEKNTTVLKEVHRLRKPAVDLNIIEISSQVNISTLRLLARGRATLSMRVNRTNSPFKTVLKGPILPKLSCEMFYAPLIAGPRAEPQIASGVTWFHFNRESALEYEVQVDELDMMKSPMITLVDETNKRHIDLEQLAHFQSSGRATGILDKMGPKIFEPLYFGDLVVYVTTFKTMSEDTTVELVRGKLMSRPVSNVMDLSGPILLKRLDLTRPADIIGLAWISVDHECSIQWEVTIAGTMMTTDLELWVDLRPVLALGAPFISKKLGNLNNPEGVLLSPPLADLDYLRSGACELVVKDARANTTLMRAILKQIKVPETCLPQNNNNNNEMQPAYEPSNSNSVADAASCILAGVYHSDGSQWTSSSPCTLCSCHHGKVKCDSIICPVLSCGSKAVKYPGECCSICPNPSLENDNISSTTQGCHMGGQFHPAGQSWHPYLPPAGFDTCVNCTCDSRSLQVHCDRVSCPPLNCSEKDVLRPSKKACCRVCVHKEQRQIEHKDGPMSPQEILAEGGCKYTKGEVLRNGEERHSFHSSDECVICKCKNRKLVCNYKKCSKSCNSSPPYRRKLPNKNGVYANSSSTDECCHTCRRNNRRHQKHRRGNVSV